MLNIGYLAVDRIISSRAISRLAPPSSLQLSIQLADSKFCPISVIKQKMSSWQELASYKYQILANPIHCTIIISASATEAHTSFHPKTHKQPLQWRTNYHLGLRRDPSNQLAHRLISYHADAASY